jgi:hypothetical protein
MERVLPSDRPTSPFRRLLHSFGLANAADERLRQPLAAPRSARLTAPPEVEPGDVEWRVSPRRAAAERGARTALVFFGLVDDPERDRRSRYGEVSRCSTAMSTGFAPAWPSSKRASRRSPHHSGQRLDRGR